MSNESTVVKSEGGVEFMQSLCDSAASGIHEVSRELQVRQRCYPRWVTEGKLTEYEAKERLERLAVAKGHLEAWRSMNLVKLAKMLDRAVAVAA